MSRTVLKLDVYHNVYEESHSPGEPYPNCALQKGLTIVESCVVQSMNLYMMRVSKYRQQLTLDVKKKKVR